MSGIPAWVRSSVFAATLLAGCRFTYEWESLGPFETSGPIRHLILDPVNSHRLYAASENGGLWVLDDVTEPGAGWRPLSDDLENLQMRGVAKSMVDSSYVVTANASGRVYHTFDHGASWTPIVDQQFSYIRRLLLREGLTRVPAGNYTRLAKETMVLVAGSTGLHRLRLVNDAFERVDTLFPRLPAHGNDVFDLARDPNGSETLFIGVRRQGVWRSQDGGQTWELVLPWTSFPDAASDKIRLASNGARVVAKLGRNVIVNDQRGDAIGWRQTATVGFGTEAGGNDIGYRGNYSGRTGEWTGGLAIHPSDTTVMAVGQATLFTTQDGGATWDTTPAGHEDVQALAYSPDGSVLYVANDGGVWSLRPPATGVTDLNRNLTTLQFYRAAKNGTRVVGNADHQGIRGTGNIEADSPQWRYATVRASGYGNNALENDFVSGDPTLADRFYVAFEDRDLLRLRFSGGGPVAADLLAMNDTSAPVRPFTMRTNLNLRSVNNQLNYPVGTVAFDPRAGSTVMWVAAHRALNTSFEIRGTATRDRNPAGGPRTDCGDASGATFCFTQPLQNTSTFATRFGPVGTPIVSIVMPANQPGRAYALLEDGQVVIQTDIDDPAHPWDSLGVLPLEPNGVARQLAVDREAPGRLYALSHGSFFGSEDGGLSWQARGGASVGPERLNTFVQHPTRAHTLYLGTATDVRISEDRGANWRSIGMRLPNVTVMQLFVDGQDLYAVTFGRGLWRASMPK